MRVLHLITTLDLAGAELLLERTVARMDPGRVTGEVVCLAPPGPVAGMLEASGWRVHSLRMERGRIRLDDISRLRRIIEDASPDVLHSWMYHADFVTLFAAGTPRRKPGVIWSLHQSELPRADIPLRTRFVARANAVLSHVVPDRIVATSQAAADFHASLGYARGKMVLVPSAFALVEAADGDDPLRAELGLPVTAPVVGRVGRYHPQKDYPTMVAAAGEILRACRDAHVVLIGDGVEEDNPLFDLSGVRDVRDRLHLLGERADAVELTRWFTVAVSSSAFGESTPLVIGEAMAAGVPVITTDVGDSRQLVGEAGRVVPPRSPGRLAEAVLDLLRLSPSKQEELGLAARERIGQGYSLDAMADRYTDLYESLLTDLP